MKSSRLLLINTGATYLRSLIAMGLSVFSARWVLAALGVVDFGVFNLVTSLIVFVTFTNAVLANSAARFFAYSIGRQNDQELREWFAASVVLHLFFALGLVFIGYFLGTQFIERWISLPADRVSDAKFAFQISLVPAFFSMLAVPFVGMMTARQRIAEVSVIASFQTLLTFICALLIGKVEGARLVIYVSTVGAVTVVTQMLYIGRGYRGLSACALKTAAKNGLSRQWEIIRFAFWNMFGSLGGTFRDQGSALLLNRYFGPSVNASYGLALQMSNAANQFSLALIGAFSPEITRLEGAGERKQMLSLAERVNKYGTLLILLFSVPLLMEMKYIVQLWLGSVPDYTVPLCRFVLAVFIIDRLTAGYMLAVNAFGKTAAYQATLGSFLVVGLPIAWGLLEAHIGVYSVGLAAVFSTFLCSVGRVYWVSHYFGVKLADWLKKTLISCMAPACFAIAVSLPIHMVLSESITRVLLVGITYGLALAFVSYKFVLSQPERKGLSEICRSFYNKVVKSDTEKLGTKFVENK